MQQEYPVFQSTGLGQRKFLKTFPSLINLENFTDARQSNYESVVNGSHINPTFDEIWTHPEGFVIKVVSN